MRDSLSLLFADDTNLCISGQPDNIVYLLSRVQKCMETVIEWMEMNLMELNIEKKSNGVSRKS